MTALAMVDDDGDDVEALVRSARAGVAKLRLQLRSTLADVERAERADGDLDRGAAREVLRLSLVEMLDQRGDELAVELSRARQDAAKVISDAHAQAAEIVAERERAATAAAMRPPTPLLAVVPSPPPAAAALSLAAGPEPRVATEPQLALVPPVADPEPDADLEPDVWAEPEEEAAVTPEQTPPAEALVVAPTGSTAAVPSPDYAEVVHAAVSASLASMSATQGPAVGPARTVAPAPLHRRLLHLDVVLPLVAISVVIIVLLAWVG